MTPRSASERSVFSLWAWLVLAPYLLTVFGGYDQAGTPEQWAIGIATAIEVHLALGLAFLLLAAIEHRLTARPVLRWLFVGLAIAGLAVGRPALMRTLQLLFGTELVDTPFELRIAMNLVVFVISLLLMHTAAEALAQSLEVRHRLLALLSGLRIQADRVEQEEAAIAASFRHEVADPVIDALGRLVSRALPPEQLAEELSWVAELVVRPISHRTRTAELDEAIADLDPTLTTPAPARAVLQPPRIVAAPAWAISAITSLLLLPAELEANGVAPGLLLLVAGAVASFLGGRVVQRLPLPERAGPAMTVLALAYLIVGAITCWVLIGPTLAQPQAPLYLADSTLAFATVAIVLTIILSSRRELVANQDRIASAIGHAERRVFRARERLAATGERIARVLHTGVQGDIVGTALRLKAGTARPDALDRLLDRVVVALKLDPAPETASPAGALREALRAAVSTWSRALDLSVDLPDPALERLTARPSAAALANDAITEGLTNAVRHGRAGRIRLSAAADEEGVEIRITSPGRLGPRSTGLGLRDLEARARRVELAQDGEEVVLRVLV